MGSIGLFAAFVMLLGSVTCSVHDTVPTAPYAEDDTYRDENDYSIVHYNGPVYQCCENKNGVCDSQPLLDSVPDDKFTASSTHESGSVDPLALAPPNSRLNKCPANQEYGCGWAPKNEDQKKWIQVDLGKEYYITKVAVQPRGHDKYYNYQNGYHSVSKYYLKFSCDGETFYRDDNNGQDYSTGFSAATQYNAVHYQELSCGILARYVRLYVQEYNAYPAVRWDIYGCHYALNFPAKKSCPY